MVGSINVGTREPADRATTPMATATPPVPTRPEPAAARGRDGGPLDTTVRLVTPERIVFLYPLAGPFRRVCAYAIDLAVKIAMVLATVFVFLVLSLGSPSAFGPILVAWFVLDWGYNAGLEALFNGRTVGKRAVGIRVVSDQGVPITGAQAVLRNLVGAVDGLLPFVYLPGLTTMMLTAKFQRLGDLAAGTMVVLEERQRRSGVVKVTEAPVAALLPWLPVRIAAGPELARALSDYVKRRERFAPPLREEMAGPLARPLRERFGLPAGATADAVLCAVYHRVFLGE
jgi:uncharacterized RDD family membrane protein YckC